MGKAKPTVTALTRISIELKDRLGDVAHFLRLSESKALERALERFVEKIEKEMACVNFHK
jgi:hypothetical protein